MENEEAPITLTLLAAKKILEFRVSENVPADHFLRLGVRGGGCSGFSYAVFFDEMKPDVDRKFTMKFTDAGAEISVDIIVDNMSLTYLMGTEIDYIDGLAGTGFKFNNPNVKTTCGCGSSFSA